MDGYFNQTSHTCNYCSKVLSTYGELVEHKKTHVGDRPFSCHICHKRFTQKAHLNIHKRTHTGEKPYACTICHKRFAQSSHLNSHRRIHAGDRPYFCVICNTGFSQKHRFDAHLPCMNQAKSRSSARISAAISSSVSMSAAVASYSSRGNRSSGRAVDNKEVDQKPDISYLEALNQQALIQQLAEFSAASSDSPITKVKKPQEELEEGEINSNRLASDCTLQKASKEDIRGSISAACKPGVSSHRRKPAIIRHVDNEDSSSSHGFSCKAGTDSAADGTVADDTNVLSAENSVISFKVEEDSEARAQFHNGIVHHNERFNNGRDHAEGAIPANQSLLPMRISPFGSSSTVELSTATAHSGQRISLVNFTAEELLNHLMSRSDIHRCDFCRLIFQDAALYHIHRNMHDKNDLRCCNFCGKMLQDKYDFMAHFLHEHR